MDQCLFQDVGESTFFFLLSLLLFLLSAFFHLFLPSIKREREGEREKLVSLFVQRNRHVSVRLNFFGGETDLFELDFSLSPSICSTLSSSLFFLPHSPFDCLSVPLPSSTFPHTRIVCSWFVRYKLQFLLVNISILVYAMPT